MPPLRSRLAATISALALGLPLAAGAVGASASSATATPRLGTDAVISRAALPVTATATRWTLGRRAAQAALERAQRSLGAHRSAAASATGGDAASQRGDLTLTLRDLHAGLRYLSPEDRVAARGVLARPTQGANDPNGSGYRTASQNDCAVSPTPGSHVCVYWVSTTSDAPPLADGDGDGVPNRVETTRDVLNSVWDRIVSQGGYRKPLPDGRGFDDRLDVFLADIGSQGLFGYCAPEAPGPGRTATGYCVLDDDFAAAQFGTTHIPLENLEVTAAHEFFHAVQFAYDVAEDDWFMEGTAMWMEDEMYDEVNDNVRYLRGSQLTTPTRALDQPASGLGGPYVSWIFWRYVTETFPDRGTTGLPLIMRDVWRRAQAYTSHYPRTYSVRALSRAISARGNTLSNVFARFGEANRHPADAYDEGAEQHYPRVPAVASYRLSTARRSTGEKVATMAHLTNYTVVLTPDSSLGSADWVVRIPVNAPNYRRGSRAQLSVVLQDGSRVRRWVRLNKYGNGVGTAKFRYGQVKRVELTLTNSGQRYACYRGTHLACQGVSRDNGLKTYFRATLKQAASSSRVKRS